MKTGTPNSAEQLGALWQGKPTLQMNLGWSAEEILPRKSMFWGVSNHWPDAAWPEQM